MAPERPAGEHHHLDVRIDIGVPPADVFDCFFSPNALRVWWQAARAIVTPVPFGVYAIEWTPTVHQDDILGTLGGVFHGTVVEVRRGHGFLVADAYWIPPRGTPIGPMAFQVELQPRDGGCRLAVRQDGYEPSPRWSRYYAVINRGWDVSLASLKRYAEGRPAGR